MAGAAPFALPGHLRFVRHASGLMLAEFQHAAASAVLCLQGAHLFDWRLHGEPVLWLSRDAVFAPGKSIRGGVPVCWPWFGPHASDPSQPAHGFARTALWTPVSSAIDADGTVALTLRLETAHAAGWPHAATAELTISVGEQLRMSLSTRNEGNEACTLGEALHTYFRISDIAAVTVSGLDGVDYWDTVGGVTRKTQEGVIAFAQETDRVYINAPQACVIEDPGLRRRIHVRKQGSLSTVVWNPWTDKAERMGDLGKPDGWRGFVCVESANAWDNKLTLAPGERHTLDAEYAVEAIK
jgi:D-hexose-6-phosphate mutarotase